MIAEREKIRVRPRPPRRFRRPGWHRGPPVRSKTGRVSARGGGGTIRAWWLPTWLYRYYEWLLLTHLDIIELI